jgi:hypothetical protein
VLLGASAGPVFADDPASLSAAVERALTVAAKARTDDFSELVSRAQFSFERACQRQLAQRDGSMVVTRCRTSVIRTVCAAVVLHLLEGGHLSRAGEGWAYKMLREDGQP